MTEVQSGPAVGQGQPQADAGGERRTGRPVSTAGGTESVPQAASANPPPAPTMSAKRATVGRVVHVYSDQWTGPRPGMVVFAGEGEQPCYTANVSLDGTGIEDRAVLAQCRQAVTGNSFAGLPLYDPLTPERREQALALAAPFGNPQTRMIAEWPPVV